MAGGVQGDPQHEVSAEDLEASGDAAWWRGDVAESDAAYERAYRAYVAKGDHRGAARASAGIAVSAFLRGDASVGSSWLSRAQRLLDDVPECLEQGLLLYFEVEGALAQADAAAVAGAARRVREMGERLGEPSLVALGVLGEGRAALRDGRVADGMVMLDQAMLAAVSGEVPPEFTGNIYCHLIAACFEVGDLRRAAEWTAATERWLAQLPEAVLFAGICRVHRAQLQQLRGEWDDAVNTAAKVCAELAGFHLATAAEAFYAIGEIRRLQGDEAGAEEAYTQAHRLGRQPQPGLALLRLAQGRADAAAVSLRSALASETGVGLARVPLRAAQVEVALSAGDDGTARAACDELDEVATTYGTPGLVALARQARGSLLLAQGRAGEALAALRIACGLWRELRAPYEVARSQVLLARAYGGLGDVDAEAMELDAAEETFERLGARRDLAVVRAMRGRPKLPDGLTAREAEVLALVASGRTNRQVAAVLVLSEKTVARHLANVYVKLGISTRTAATAYAFEHGLVPRADA